MQLRPSELSSDQLRSAGRNAVLLREAEAIASALEAESIPALFLKGIALLETVYTSLVARAIADIDLLLRAEDLEEASAVLGGCGYVPCSNAMVLTKSVGRIRVDVDLHADLWFFGSDKLWRRSRYIGHFVRIRIPCPEDVVLHCILHSVIQDGKVSQTALADCRAILEMEEGGFSWDTFAATVAEEGWEKPVALFLERLEARYPGLVPETRLRALACSPVRFGQSPSFRWPYLRMFSMQSRWRRRTQLVLNLLFPHRLFLQRRYSWTPRKLAFLLPVLRPFLLLAECISCRLDSSRH
ncbi:MAG TPA: nucleotidyltransferase family protein [archaeon]|nr:nucleotidyltransferase family protein [archaeon]